MWSKNRSALLLLTVAISSLTVQAQRSKTDLTAVDLSPEPEKSTSFYSRILDSPDTFQPIHDTAKTPWRAVCKLQVIFPSGSGEGTGVLVGKHHVLTAAHNFFDPRKGGWAKDVRVVPAYNQGRIQYGTSRAVKLISMSGYTENRDPDYDLGFVITRDDIGSTTGWFGMALADVHDLRSANLQMVGYPSEGDYDGETLQNTPCKVTRTTSRKVFYRTNTYEGMSGSPIFAHYQPYGQSETGGVVVGIHTSGDETENSGPTIRNEIWHWVLAALATSNSTISGLWLLDGNTLRITLNGVHVKAVYEKVLDPYGPIKPGHVEFQGLIDGKRITGRDTIFYSHSPQNIQCRVAGSMVDVDIILNISQDEQTMTGAVQYWAPDEYCRLFLVTQNLTFTKVAKSR